MVEEDFQQLNAIIERIIKPYCKSLDDSIKQITKALHDIHNPPTTTELDYYCMHLSTDIYWAASMSEQLGIKDDISKAIYKETYNRVRDTSEGTVADKNTLAELSSQQEYLTNVCYSRAYRIMKSKVENAQELLQSIKKVLSHRISEQELTRIGG
jgi:hypothetical protein